MDDVQGMGEELIKVINDKVAHEVHHAVENIVNSPMLLNRTIGEAMRHVGAHLDAHSAPYLPVRPEEILVDPAVISPVDCTGVLLLRRGLTSANGFTLLAISKTDEKNVRSFDLYGYKPDTFDLYKTEFINFTEEVGKELVRQLNTVMTSDGIALFQCVIVSNYFPVTAADDTPTNTVQVTEKETTGLPPVDDVL